MKCIHLGDNAGVVVNECCGGGERTVDLYSCQSPKQSADYCVLSSGTKGLASVRLEGESNRQILSVAVCLTCPHREQASQPLPIPIVNDERPKSNARRMWEEIRNRRNPNPTIGQVAVLDCDRHGFGDAIMAAWIAEGSKNTNPRLALRATGAKRTLLELLGQEVLSIEATVTYGGEYVLGITSAGAPPSIIARGLKLGIPSPPRRPTIVIPDELLEWSQPSDVLLFPQCYEVNRTWPHDNWVELYNLIVGTGRTVKVIGIPDERWEWCPNWMTNLSWGQIAAMMKRSMISIGNDSGPMHLAGTLDRPGIALLGRTTEVVFSMYQSVVCLQAEKREVPCAGCWGGWGHVSHVCNNGCVALSHITPSNVLDTLKAMA